MQLRRNPDKTFQTAVFRKVEDCGKPGQCEKHRQQSAHWGGNKAVDLVIFYFCTIQIFQREIIIVLFIGCKCVLNEPFLLQIAHGADVRMDLQPCFQHGFLQRRIELSEQLLTGNL